jgi:hypothetical protein
MRLITHTIRDGVSAFALGILAFGLTLTISSTTADAQSSRNGGFPSLAVGTTTAKDRTLGTAVTWERSISAAAEKARREGKLVYVIHVSGDFEDPEFT